MKKIIVKYKIMGNNDMAANGTYWYNTAIRFDTYIKRKELGMSIYNDTGIDQAPDALINEVE